MKKFLTVALMSTIVLFVGCASEKTEEKDSFVVKATYLQKEEAERARENMSEGLIVEGAFWLDKKENIPDFLEAIETRDDEFFLQQFRENKIYRVNADTRINCSKDTSHNGKIVKIKFLRGQYKNKEGYTYKKFVAIK